MADLTPSLSQMARDLKQDESISRSRRILLTDKTGMKSLTKTLSSMRNSMNQIATRAKDITGNTYRVESGQFITDDREAIVLTVCLTCLEDDGEDDI